VSFVAKVVGAGAGQNRYIANSSLSKKICLARIRCYTFGFVRASGARGRHKHGWMFQPLPTGKNGRRGTVTSGVAEERHDRVNKQQIGNDFQW